MPVGPTAHGRAAKAMRLLMAVVGVLTAFLAGATVNVLLGGLVLLTWTAAMTTGTWITWRRSDVALERTAARRQVKLAGREVTRQRAWVSEVRKARAALDGDERRALKALEDQRAALSQAAATHFARTTRELRKELTKFQGALSGLDASRAIETRRQLQALQQQHVQAYIASRSIRPGVIHGIGPTLVGALRAHGLRTAADLAGVRGASFRRSGSNNWFTISGIGPAKAAAIHSWHQHVLNAAQQGAPQSLPALRVTAINTRFADQRRQQQAAIDSVALQMQRIKAPIDAKYAAWDREFTPRGEAVRLDYRSRRSAADAQVAQSVTQLQRVEDALVDAQRNLARYRHVSFSKYVMA